MRATTLVPQRRRRERKRQCSNPNVVSAIRGALRRLDKERIQSPAGGVRPAERTNAHACLRARSPSHGDVMLAKAVDATSEVEAVGQHVILPANSLAEQADLPSTGEV